MAIPVSELQKINPSSIIELFELELTQAVHGSDFTYRFHAGINDVGSGIQNLIWNGNTYSKFPIEVEGFEYNAESGTLPRPRIRVANLLGSITAILLDVNTTTAGNDLTGAKLTRIRTLVRYIDNANFSGGTNPFGTPDTTAKLPDEIFYVARKISEGRDMVEFELAAAFDLAGVRAPKRQCSGNLCPWIYRGSECGYSGSNFFDVNDNKVSTSAADICGKRLSSCSVRFGETAELPFGGFPGIGAFNG
jgi:lambda family phage minor tail protein L